MFNWSFRRHMTAALRIATLVVVALTVFWFTFNLTMGSVPTRVGIELGNWNHGLESTWVVGYNRYLDVPFAFVAIMIFWLLYALILRGAKAEEKVEIERGLIAGMIGGFVFSFAGICSWYCALDWSVILTAFLGAISVCLYPALKLRGVLVCALALNFITGVANSIIIGVGIGMAMALLGTMIMATTAVVLIGIGLAVTAFIGNFRGIIDWIGELLGQLGRWLVAADVDSD